MKVLVIGGGGREHALVWKLGQSRKVHRIYCAPGNAGIAQAAECVPIEPDALSDLLSFARSARIALTLVGPELPLSLGIVDEFEKAGLKIFGPRKAAARLEASKAYAKQFMAAHRIPTAASRSFESHKEALVYVRGQPCPLVIKADGLAAGKGVVIAQTPGEAEEAVSQMMQEGVFGAAGEKIVVEEFLAGQEATVLAFTDGRAVSLMPASQDHKRLGDGDRGPNTGGMGAYAPAPVVTSEIRDQVLNRVVMPTLRGLAEAGCPYKGVLYCGIMICGDGIRVLEYNCRFGDPEAQAVLPLLETDLVDLASAVVEERLDQVRVQWRPGAALCVVLASKGYPGKSPKGIPIEGLDQLRGEEDVILFHSGTALQQDRVVTSGGRVLGLTALGGDLGKARDRAYEVIRRIRFEGAQYRSDIGARAL